MAISRTRSSLQQEAAQIFNARRAAERLLARTSTERAAVLSMSRDELAALAQQMADVSAIAERHHLERATAGSMPSDAFPGPADA